MRMLIEHYDIELSTPACDLESPIYAAKVTFEADITKALPYVNATVEKGEFLPGIPVLVWKDARHRYALRPHEIAISNITDRGEGSEAAAEIVTRINHVWEKRAEMEPSYESFEKPKVLDVLKLLPRSNCKQCGEPTCMAYATRLTEGKRALGECPPLAEADFSEQICALQEMGLE
jgi:ArsR family metal-binding transcriptional regulator